MVKKTNTITYAFLGAGILTVAVATTAAITKKHSQQNTTSVSSLDTASKIESDQAKAKIQQLENEKADLENQLQNGGSANVALNNKLAQINKELEKAKKEYNDLLAKNSLLDQAITLINTSKDEAKEMAKDNAQGALLMNNQIDLATNKYLLDYKNLDKAKIKELKQYLANAKTNGQSMKTLDEKILAIENEIKTYDSSSKEYQYLVAKYQEVKKEELEIILVKDEVQNKAITDLITKATAYLEQAKKIKEAKNEINDLISKINEANTKANEYENKKLINTAKYLKDEIAKVQKVLDNFKDKNELVTAKNNLVNAIEESKTKATDEKAKIKLDQKIIEAKNYITSELNENQYETIKADLEKAIIKAKGIYDTTVAKKVYEDATNELETKLALAKKQKQDLLNSIQSAIQKYNELKTKATTLITELAKDPKYEALKNELQTAVDNTQNTVNQNDKNPKIIAQAANELNTAYNKALGIEELKTKVAKVKAFDIDKVDDPTLKATWNDKITAAENVIKDANITKAKVVEQLKIIDKLVSYIDNMGNKDKAAIQDYKNKLQAIIDNPTFKVNGLRFNKDVVAPHYEGKPNPGPLTLDYTLKGAIDFYNKNLAKIIKNNDYSDIDIYKKNCPAVIDKANKLLALETEAQKLKVVVEESQDLLNTMKAQATKYQNIINTFEPIFNAQNAIYTNVDSDANALIKAKTDLEKALNEAKSEKQKIDSSTPASPLEVAKKELKEAMDNAKEQCKGKFYKSKDGPLIRWYTTLYQQKYNVKIDRVINDSQKIIDTSSDEAEVKKQKDILNKELQRSLHFYTVQKFLFASGKEQKFQELIGMKVAVNEEADLASIKDEILKGVKEFEDFYNDVNNVDSNLAKTLNGKLETTSTDLAAKFNPLWKDELTKLSGTKMTEANAAAEQVLSDYEAKAKTKTNEDVSNLYMMIKNAKNKMSKLENNATNYFMIKYYYTTINQYISELRKFPTN